MNLRQLQICALSFIAVAVTSCRRAPAPSEAEHRPGIENQTDRESPASFRLWQKSPLGGAAPSGLAVVAKAGRFVVTSGSTPSPAPNGWELLSTLGASRQFKKLQSPLVLVQQMSESAEPDPALSAYLSLDGAAMPKSDTALRAALERAGYQAQTVAGTITTGMFHPRALETILAIPWVTALELGSKIRPR